MRGWGWGWGTRGWLALVLAGLLIALNVGAPGVAIAAGGGKSGGSTKGGNGAKTSTAVAPSGATGPFSPGVPQAPVTVPTTTTAQIPTATTSSSSSSGFSSTDALLVALGAVVVIGGIAFFIWYDARRNAPVASTGAAAGIDGRGRSGSKAPPKSRKLSSAERKRRKRGRAR